MGGDAGYNADQRTEQTRLSGRAPTKTTLGLTQKWRKLSDKLQFELVTFDSIYRNQQKKYLRLNLHPAHPSRKVPAKVVNND